MKTYKAEEWRKIPGLGDDGYEVSSHGRVRSLKRGVNQLKLQRTEHGGVTVVVSANGVKVGLSVARTVALAFIGEPPFPNAFARHRDMDQSNNRPENLFWDKSGRRRHDIAA